MNCAEAVCETSPEDAAGIIVKFKERYEAEQVVEKLGCSSWLTVVFAKVGRTTIGPIDGNLVYPCDEDAGKYYGG